MAIQESVQNRFHSHIANFPPSPWGLSFASFSFPCSEFDSYSRQVEAMKKKVKEMMVSSTKDVTKNIEFINLLCRLGVSYHFESEIKEQLNHIFRDLPRIFDYSNDLYTTSLLFRVFRQHGLKMSCDVFNKFKDSDGKFKKEHISDVKAVLCLYEACHVRVHGEDIMDEALTFTREILESFVVESMSPLSEHIKNALNIPFHKGIQRLESRNFISYYQQDESPNETLLMFAKLDFNRLQLLHKNELALLSRWRKEHLNLEEKLPYARDRVVELYLWALGFHFEPQYALSRILVTKFATIISILDDTYDVFAKPQELHLLTDVIVRCDTTTTDKLPDYMKFIYKSLLDVLNEARDIGNKEDGTDDFYYGMEAFKELVGAYDTEAKWSNEGYVPDFDEYLQIGMPSTGYGVLLTASFIGMEFTTTKNFEWLQSNPKFVRALEALGRIENDIVTHEDEQKRGDCATTVECYMKEHGVSKEKAIEELEKCCGNLWKDINEEFMKPNADLMPRLNHVLLNLARVTQVFYWHVDKYTKSGALHDEINSLFIEIIALD